MKRTPAALWILLPLLLGLLYALLHPLFEQDPDPRRIAPEGAVLIERFRDFDTFDRHYYIRLGPDAPPPSSLVALENNVKGLPGVDRDRPVHLIKMPPSRIGLDPTVAIFPLADRDAFSDVFHDPEMLEKGLIRRAKYLEFHGSWAAVGARRAAVRRIGTGTLHAAERDEDFAIAADVFGLATMAAANGNTPPWKGVLAALDVDPSKMTWSQVAGEDRQIPTFTGASKLARIVSTWRIARLWSWAVRGRIEVELTTDVALLQEALAAVTKAEADARIPPPPAFTHARLWLRVPHGAARKALFLVLHEVGLDIPRSWREQPGDGGLLALGTRAPGHPYASSLAVAVPGKAPLDLAVLLGELPAAGARRPLPAGAAAITVIDRGIPRKSPAGLLARGAFGGLDVLALGVDAPSALTRLQTLAEGTGGTGTAPLDESGWHLIASLGLDALRAEKLLGGAIGEFGLLAAVRGGPVHAELRTDGRSVRLVIRGQGRK